MATCLLVSLIAVYVFNYLFALSSAVTTTCRATRKTSMDGKVAADRLLWKFTTRGTATCLGECSRDELCAGIFYNKFTGNCQGHSINFGDVNDATDDLHSRHFVKGDQYIGDECTSDTDCSTLNAECRLNKCLCEPGYSFAPRDRTCLADSYVTEITCRLDRNQCPVGRKYTDNDDTDCSVYGPEFLEVRDHYISKTNIETFPDVSLSECKSLCSNRTSFTCKTLEYGRSTKTCFLQNATMLQWQDRWFADTIQEYNISYYQRDCD